MNSERSGLINFVAFIAIMVIALLEVFSVLAHFDVLTVGGTLNGGGILINVLNTIKNVAVVLVMGVTAYKYASNRKKGVKIAYWIAVLIIVVATVLMWIEK